MPSGAVAGVLRFLRRLRGEHSAAPDSDRLLLERFAQRRDEDAFALLLDRHAAMVHGVCLRLLRDPHEAEDAFQATFLILARKAGVIAWHESVAGWLHETAVRVAMRARAALPRLMAPDKQTEPAMPAAEPSHHAAQRELRAIIDEELAHLPEKYRAPLVLCYLEGRTNEEAAQQLGWTKGTLSGRLARARDLLRPRLARRGLALSSATLALALPSLGGAAVSSALTQTTLKAAVLYATTPAAAAGVVSTKIMSLSEGVMKTMFLSRFKKAALLALICILGVAATLFAYHHWAPTPQEETTPPAKVAEKPAEKPKTDTEKLQGTWHIVGLEASGKKALVDYVTGDTKMVIRKDDFVEYHGDIGVVATFALDPTKTPKAIDWLQNFGGTDARTGLKTDHWVVIAVGIYELDKDTLRVAKHYGDEPPAGLKPPKRDLQRPTTFKTGALSNFVVTTYQRGEPPVPVLPKQPEFVQADITLHSEPGKEPLKKVVKDKDTLARLVTCFPQMARGMKSKFAGGWIAATTIHFLGSKGEKVSVSVSHNWSNWSEGHGDWLLKGNLLKPLGEIFEQPEMVEKGRFLDPWNLVTFEENGKKRNLDKMELGISYYDFELQENDDDILPVKGYSIDAAKKPKEIDLHITLGKAPRSYLGIYEVAGDTMRICIDRSEKVRPTEFRTTAGSNRILLVLKAR